MKIFFKKAGITVLIALAVVILITGISYLLGGSSIFAWSFRGIMAPFEKLAGKGVAALEQIYGYMHDYDELKKENRELKAQIARMEEKVRLSEDALKENDRLRELLNLSKKNKDYEFVDAMLISWSSSNWASSFFIDKGTRSGINVGDCVVTEEGLVIGLITEAGVNTSTVKTLIDSSSAIGALLQDASITAVAEGDFELMTRGCLKLTYIFDNSEVLIGDTVLTSGSGGLYPSGLVLGKITDLKTDMTGYDDYGIITPAADLTSLTEVFVIKNFEADNED
jgi:rod shape-determining protein MreC